MPLDDPIEAAIVSELRAAGRVTALVGEGTAAKIYPKPAPSSARLPMIVFERQTGGEHVQHMGGMAGLAQAPFRLECWAGSYAQALELGEAVRLSLVGNRGTWGTDSQNYVRGCFLDNLSDDDGPPIGGEDRPERARVLDLTIWYSETTS